MSILRKQYYIGKHWIAELHEPELYVKANNHLGDNADDVIASILRSLYELEVIKYAIYAKCSYHYYDFYLEFNKVMTNRSITAVHSLFAACKLYVCSGSREYRRTRLLTLNDRTTDPVEIGYFNRAESVVNADEPVRVVPTATLVRAARNELMKDSKGEKCPQLILLVGTKNSGKSTWIRRHFNGDPTQIYWKNPSDAIWHGYCYQDVVVLDDYNGYLPFAHLLKLTGPNTFAARFDAASDHKMYVHPKVVIISSSMNMKFWYPKRTKDWQPLKNRISKVLWFHMVNPLLEDIPEPTEFTDWEAFSNAVLEERRILRAEQSILRQQRLELDQRIKYVEEEQMMINSCIY